MSWTSTIPRALAKATSRSKKSRPTTAVVGLWGNETTITLGGGEVLSTASVRWAKKSTSSDSGTRWTFAPDSTGA